MPGIAAAPARILLSALSLLSAAVPATAFEWSPADRRLLAEARQAVVVLADGWDSSRGELALFERDGDGAGGPWTPAGAAVPALLGQNGLGLGPGSGASTNPPDPRKREGDLRSPAGVFRITAAFGHAARNDAAFIRLPYIHLDGTRECVDDPGSVHYNRLVRKSAVPRPDWMRSERMALPDRRYRWGAVIGYNADPPRPGAGSCIFLHVRLDAATPTRGCTAVEEAHLLSVLRRLRPEARPILVQLPRKEYERIRGSAGLP